MYTVMVMYEDGAIRPYQFDTLAAANAFVVGVGEGISNHARIMSVEAQQDNAAVNHTVEGFVQWDASTSAFIKALDEIANIMDEAITAESAPVDTDEPYWQEIMALLPDCEV